MKRLKKRYWIPLILIMGMYGCSQLPILTLRKSEKAQQKALLKSGQSAPFFGVYQVSNRDMHYTHLGHDTLPLVVLVHGSPGSSSAFLDYLSDRNLSQKAQVVAVDRPGFGYSGFGKTERSLEKQAAALKPILDKHRHQKAILVGHSFGGPVIARMAIDFPELVDGLVIVAGSIDPDLEPREWWRKPLNWFFIRWLLPKSLKVCNQEILPLYLELERMKPLWKKIICPVTVIQGEADNLVPAGNANFAKKMLVNSSKVDIQIIKGGDHFILWSLQEQVVEAIVKML